jgi:hypothetical protein
MLLFGNLPIAMCQIIVKTKTLEKKLRPGQFGTVLGKTCYEGSASRKKSGFLSTPAFKSTTWTEEILLTLR